MHRFRCYHVEQPPRGRTATCSVHLICSYVQRLGRYSHITRELGSGTISQEALNSRRPTDFIHNIVQPGNYLSQQW